MYFCDMKSIGTPNRQFVLSYRWCRNVFWLLFIQVVFMYCAFSSLVKFHTGEEHLLPRASSNLRVISIVSMTLKLGGRTLGRPKHKIQKVFYLTGQRFAGEWWKVFQSTTASSVWGGAFKYIIKPCSLRQWVSIIPFLSC
jgi:hypothetical protein